MRLRAMLNKTSSTQATHVTPALRNPLLVTAALALLILLLFAPTIYELTVFWWNSEEYNYGLLIPPIAIYILYQQKSEILESACGGSLWAITGLTTALLFYLAAILADIESVKRYAMIVSLASLALAIGGWPLLKRSLFALLLLLFALPLPYLLGSILTTKMQLLSSDIGVMLIRIMGLPVFQDGNVINMSGFQMLVAEACSGLRYLYPLMAIALIISYFYRASFASKVAIFLLAIPITIGMNSLRIAITGVLIKHFGKAAAEGFLHDFEGWLVFFVAFVLLLFCVWFLHLISNAIKKTHIRFVDRFDWDGTPERDVRSTYITTKIAIVFGATSIIGIACASALIYTSPEASIPKRANFSTFPFSLDSREIYPELLSKNIRDVLKADDYFIANYKKPDRQDINLYIVYYENQRDGSALHSPKACLPGGGWEIQRSKEIPLAQFGGQGKANRVVIEQGGQKLLVYYWIQQNGENFANEFKARFSLLKQSVVSGRTDGALIRVIRPILNDDIDAAETDIGSFIRSTLPVLPIYIPST